MIQLPATIVSVRTYLRGLGAGLVAVVGMAVAWPAHAACSEVIFNCDLGDRDETGAKVLRSVNLKHFRAGRRSDSWVAKRCEVSYADPPGCSWRGGGGGGGGGSVVLTSGGSNDKSSIAGSVIAALFFSSRVPMPGSAYPATEAFAGAGALVAA